MVNKKSKKTIKKVSRKDEKDDDRKLFAFLATFLSIVGFIIVLVAKKKDKYIMFYAKQSLIVFIAYVISGIVALIPIIGGIASPILYLITFILWVFSWIYALSGIQKQTPIIGHFAKDINL